ncbi:MAG: bifunctional tetrahydrofolate synthase/dihydrofolate synthase [Burkholderiales bacterium]
MPRQTLSEWLAYLESLHPKTIELGLGRFNQVKARLNLTPAFPIITVAGTNGKGSTCAYLEAILSRAGYRVGCYTSPHLLNYNERVRINGSVADDRALCDAFAQIEAARADISLTYFEFGTLAAMLLFNMNKLDVAILEVGLGGRLDAVNAFDADCSIIVSVDLDHQDYLGDTREKIGAEKAGVYRADRPAICGDIEPPSSVIEHAKNISARLQLINRDFGFVKMEQQWQFWNHAGKKHALPYPALRGTYQLHNASCALAALDALREKLPVSLNDIKRGLLEVDLPGRLQVLPGQPVVVLDVAHNPHAAAALAAGLGNMGFYQNTHAVFAMLKDKDIAAVISAVKHRMDFWYVAGLSAPRGASDEMLARLLDAAGESAKTRRFGSVASAYAAACEAAAQNDRIVVFGSFYTVAEVMRAIRQRPI